MECTETTCGICPFLCATATSRLSSRSRNFCKAQIFTAEMIGNLVNTLQCDVICAILACSPRQAWHLSCVNCVEPFTRCFWHFPVMTLLDEGIKGPQVKAYLNCHHGKNWGSMGLVSFQTWPYWNMIWYDRSFQMNLMKSQTSHCKESLTFVLALTRMFDSTCLRSSTIVSAYGREAPLWWRWKWLGRSRSSASPGRVLVSDHDMQRCSKGRQVRHFQAWVWRQPTKTTRNNQRQTCIYDAYMVCHDLHVHTFHIQRLYILLLYYFFCWLFVFWLLTFESQAAGVSLQIYSTWWKLKSKESLRTAEAEEQSRAAADRERQLRCNCRCFTIQGAFDFLEMVESNNADRCK